MEFPRQKLKFNRKLDFNWAGHDLIEDSYVVMIISNPTTSDQALQSQVSYETGDEVVFRGVGMGDGPPS
jgi:hypothetical protein